MSTMNTVTRHALPAIVVAPPRPAERPSAVPGRIEPVPAIEAAQRAEGRDAGRELIRVAPQTEAPASSPRVEYELELRLVSLAPEAGDTAADIGGAASLWFLAQVYGQSAESAHPPVLDSHRDAPQIGTAAYRRADAVSGVYPEQAAVFSFDV